MYLTLGTVGQFYTYVCHVGSTVVHAKAPEEAQFGVEIVVKIKCLKNVIAFVTYWCA
jgi:hypothetical protein